jgi:hypothetical protein
MAVYTDFFVASEEELRRAFPHRFPVAKRPKTRKVRNPFTGQMQSVKEWGPAKPFPALPKGITFPNKEEAKAVRKFPLVQFKGIDPVKLATLWTIIDGGELESIIEELCRPALVAPGDDCSILLLLPQAWIRAVAEIEKLGPVAKKWATTEECRLDNWNAKDASEVIAALQKLAEYALTESKNMFLWVNV